MEPDSVQRQLSVTIAHIVQRLRGSKLHSELEREARTCLHKSEVRIESLKEDLKDFLRKSGWEKKLQNAVYRELNVLPHPGHPAAPPEHTKESLMYLRRAQRSADEQKELLNKWNEMGTDEPDLSHFRPVYAPKDFLEVLINLRNPNYDGGDPTGLRSSWGLISIPLPVKDLSELRELFAELALNYEQLGIDDSMQIPVELFESEYIRLAQRVLSEQDSAAAQQYIRQGCPTGLRADMWALILNIDNQLEDSLYYEQLKSNVIQHDLLIDNLIYKDVKLTASNDDYYFVFEDYLYQVLLCFSRDTLVLDHFSYSSASPPKSYIRGKFALEDYTVVYPPNGVIPFHGFAMYVAPLCFLYHEPSKLYQVFREMYVRYFFRLHCISSHSSGIVSLCLVFETLVQTYLPQLFYHLREIGAQPLRISFKWMVRAFSGYLATDQLLLLWDRILGYNSLEILAVLAAAVFAFRAENLMEATSLATAEVNEDCALSEDSCGAVGVSLPLRQEAWVQVLSGPEAVLADLSTLKVMPLLQLFLFATSS
ncbi:TBC1 domain family member 19 isoform X2 [Hemiscyllium ocellatum]|uniref:TBC1 domain family member 19 isoform X2 n=1 Tax=Hemiscyllium ocellatum TaxID=170820 RepID=UPI00296710E5|nr:TBC1 domain family member 19 isoform X2 [Hemiscyllium ocellatum]